MSRKHLLALFSLVLLASACASTGVSGAPPTTGQRWVPELVDFLSDAGRSASLAVDQDGLPHVAYLGLNEKLGPGEIAPARPLTLPVIPAVLTADLSKNGLWNHGSVVATEDMAKPLTLKKTDVVALALDSDGNGRAAFTLNGALQYAEASGGTYGDAVKVASVPQIHGLSIAVDAKGTPWITWIQGGSLRVATKQGKAWSVQTVGPASSSSRLPVGSVVRAGSAGVLIAFTGPGGQGPMLARQSGGGWSTEQIDPHGGGYGISLALDADGNPHTAYYTSTGEVRHAHSVGGSPWEVTTIARAGRAHPAGWSASIGLDRKGAHYIAWYDGRADRVRLASNASGDFEQIKVSNTQNGELPQVGVAPNGSTVYVAWYDHVNADLDMGIYGVNGPPKVAVAVVPNQGGGTSGGPAPPPANCQPGAAKIEVTAQNLAFDTDCLAAPAGKPFEIVFTNKDTVPHNFDVYDVQGGDHLFGAQPTQTIVGSTATYKVTPQKPGNYFFQCDIHPTTMTGTFVVK